MGASGLVERVSKKIVRWGDIPPCPPPHYGKPWLSSLFDRTLSKEIEDIGPVAAIFERAFFSHLILRICQNRQYYQYYDLSHLTVGYSRKKQARGLGGGGGGFEPSNTPSPLP